MNQPDTFYRIHEALVKIDGNFKHMNCNWIDWNIPPKVVDLAEKLEKEISKHCKDEWDE